MRCGHLGAFDVEVGCHLILRILEVLEQRQAGRQLGRAGQGWAGQPYPTSLTSRRADQGLVLPGAVAKFRKRLFELYTKGWFIFASN